MASHLHDSSKRTRTSPPRTEKPKIPSPATPKTSSSDVAVEQSVEVIIVASGTKDLTGYVSALQHLASRGVLRPCALVATGAESARQLNNAFPQAIAASTLDALAIAPGALVLLASSPHLHPAQAGAALRRGWHVFSIEPLARSVREAAAITAVAERNERLLGAALPWRFSRPVEYLRALCRDQLIGPLLRLDIHDGAPVAPSASDSGDGVLLEFGLYAFDLINWCVGVPTITRYADDAMGGVETNAYVDIALPDAAQGTIHLSTDWPTSRSYEFVFERGVARWDATEGNRLTLQLASAPAALWADVVPLGSSNQHSLNANDVPSSIGHIIAELESVVTAIASQTRPRVLTADALQALTLVEYCHAHRTLLECPWFTRNEMAHARSLSTPADSPRS